jgi:hypothetical protein
MYFAGAILACFGSIIENQLQLLITLSVQFNVAQLATVQHKAVSLQNRGDRQQAQIRFTAL